MSRCRKKDRVSCRWQVPIRQSNAKFLPSRSFLLRNVETHPTSNLCASPGPMSHVDSTLPLNYLIRFFENKMASQGNHEFALNDARRHNLAHRMLLEEQQRRIETHKVLKASYRSPICPHYTISGHSDCWFCHQNGIAQPSASNDALLRSLTRPHFQVGRPAHFSLPMADQ